MPNKDLKKKINFQNELLKKQSTQIDSLVNTVDEINEQNLQLKNKLSSINNNIENIVKNEINKILNIKLETEQVIINSSKDINQSNNEIQIKDENVIDDFIII